MADIRIATSGKDLASCLEMRRTVFIKEQNVPEHEEVDGDDDHCTHVLARINGKPMGAARFQYISKKAKIQRVCVLPEARGTGLGAAIVRKILEMIKAEGKASVVVLGSQTHALSFYERLGFEAFGDEYMDAGILHQDMKIKI